MADDTAVGRAFDTLNRSLLAMADDLRAAGHITPAEVGLTLPGRPTWTLGFGKVDGVWMLYAKPPPRAVAGGCTDESVFPLPSASREVRLAAVAALPMLLRALESARDGAVGEALDALAATERLRQGLQREAAARAAAGQGPGPDAPGGPA